MLANKKHVSVRFSESKLKKRDKALAVLNDIGSDLTSSLGLTEILDRAIEKVREHFKVDAVRIYLMDDSGQNLELFAYKGLSKKQVEGLRIIPITVGFSGKAARTKSFIAQKVSELTNGQRAVLLQHVGFKVIVCVPLIIKNQVVGVMNLGYRRMLSLNEAKMDLLIAIGNQIAIAVNVSKLHEDVLQKAEKIERQKKELEFFTYSISHDLKNPAIGVAGFARLLEAKYGQKLNAKGKQYCQQIKKSAEQIDTFTKDINEYIKSKKLSLSINETDLKRILRQIKEEIDPVLKERNIAWTEPAVLPLIMADESALGRVFRNLIGNALKHGGPNLKNITIGYAQDNQYHTFSFNNDGVVMQTEGADVIFEIFRKHPDSDRSEGSGLGLAIVKEIVQAHGGRVWFETEPDKGLSTTFYVAISKNLKAGSQSLRSDLDADFHSLPRP